MIKRLVFTLVLFFTFLSFLNVGIYETSYQGYEAYESFEFYQLYANARLPYREQLREVIEDLGETVKQLNPVVIFNLKPALNTDIKWLNDIVNTLYYILLYLVQIAMTFVNLVKVVLTVIGFKF